MRALAIGASPLAGQTCQQRARPCCFITAPPRNLFAPVPSRFPRILSCRAAAADVMEEAPPSTSLWLGSDEFSHLDDRQDRPPLPLPHLKAGKRVVIVRHGQSTWNAEGRVQGSTDFAVLTAKGVAQAETTREMVRAFED